MGNLEDTTSSPMRVSQAAARSTTPELTGQMNNLRAALLLSPSSAGFEAPSPHLPDGHACVSPSGFDGFGNGTVQPPTCVPHLVAQAAKVDGDPSPRKADAKRSASVRDAAAMAVKDVISNFSTISQEGVVAGETASPSGQPAAQDAEPNAAKRAPVRPRKRRRPVASTPAHRNVTNKPEASQGTDNPNAPTEERAAQRNAPAELAKPKPMAADAEIMPSTSALMRDTDLLKTELAYWTKRRKNKGKAAFNVAMLRGPLQSILFDRHFPALVALVAHLTEEM